MQIDRLIGIAFALIKGEKTTAKKLSDRFGVSIRTIYRDLDILSCAGVPVCTDKGNGGGIEIVNGYKVENAMLSESEKQNILAMISAYNASIRSEETAKLLDKLSSVFKTSDNYIEVDFSDWSNDDGVQKTFDTLKQCIISKHVVTVNYRNSNGELSAREIEPLKLIFKSRSWYVYGYCRFRQENRLFKLARMINIDVKNEVFNRNCLENDIARKLQWNCDNINVVARVTEKIAGEIFDLRPTGGMIKDQQGGYVCKTQIPNSEWVIGYFLSLGDQIEILEPLWLKEQVKDIHIKASAIV